jgi:hypothetical protein
MDKAVSVIQQMYFAWIWEKVRWQYGGVFGNEEEDGRGEIYLLIISRPCLEDTIIVKFKMAANVLIDIRF